MIGAKNEKRCKKWLPCVLVLLLVLGMLLAPAIAKKGDELRIIDEKLQKIDDDPIINEFIYDRMLEYDNNNGIPAVKIVVIDGHWWSGKKAVKTFYVVRSATPNQIDIVEDYDGDGALWTFYPNVGQTLSALDIVIGCFEDCVACKKEVHNTIRLVMIAILVDKKNVPSMTEIISKSPWASNFLPEWAKDFLEWFGSKH